MNRLMAVALLLIANLAGASSSLNILVYHHVSEQTPASTSVSPAQFRSHLQLLRDNDFTVVALDRAIAALQQGEALPERAVAITFDDGYRNIYDNALPLLEEFGYPATLFVATDPIDDAYSNMLSWAQLRDMQQRGMVIANHTRDHDYLVRYPLRGDVWRAQIRANIEHAQQRLQTELPTAPPRWLAYPYGEYSQELAELLEELGYIGFAQHSGGVDAHSNFLALPRFAAAGIYANPATLLTKLNSRPMPVRLQQPDDMLSSEVQPTVTVELRTVDDMSSALNCFVDGNWQDARWLSAQTFSLRSEQPLTEGRHRYNCTSKSQSGNFYYWYSKPWLIYSPDADSDEHKKGR